MAPPRAGPDSYGPLAAAVVYRGEHCESVHFGALVALDQGGDLAFSVGDPDMEVFPRSAWKPAQAVGMLEHGLGLRGTDLAIVCASHSGSSVHVDRVTAILRTAGLTDDALRNTPAYPFDAGEMRDVIASGGVPRSVTMNCSGKHAGMLLTSVRNAWSTGPEYLDDEHPVQRGIFIALERLGEGGVRRGGPDGCGAPTFICGLRQLATIFRAIATSTAGTAEHAVYDAMIGDPEMCAGKGRVATDLMLAVPGLIAKDGAEGVFAAATPDGRAIALKVADGSPRSWRPIIAAAFRGLGVDMSGFAADGILARDAAGVVSSRVVALKWFD